MAILLYCQLQAIATAKNNVSDVGSFGDYWAFSPIDGMSGFSFDEYDNGTLEGVLEIDNPDLYDCDRFSVRLIHK